MKKIIIIVSISFLISCVSESQQNGLDNIAKHYNATTAFSKGFYTKKNKTINYFTITVSNSKMIDTLRADVTLSNIAMMLLDSFTDEEQEKYDFIKVTYISKAGDTLNYKYPPKILKQGLDQVTIFTDFSDKVVIGNYIDAALMLDPKFQKKNTAVQFKNYMNMLTKKHGKITGYKRLGFGALSEKGMDLFQFDGFLTFADSYKRPYVITLTKDVKNNYVMGYNFDITN